ncbi:phosphotransferase [Kribbella qitaiheensis]|uniref:phosphotransferase n=1 Tax=Kribbella qitaiheensis TaxID=1544730 RepID=UPI001FE6CDF2|nr:phosphotransferase [Kribbella qitaiheensis]
MSNPDPLAPADTEDAKQPASTQLIPGDAEPSTSAQLISADAKPFASGRDADVYSIDDSWVLRRYRNGYPVRDEADFMRWVAKYGYPVPAVRQIEGADMVIQRLAGPTVADAAIAGDLSAVEIGRMHADLHRRLHAIPAPSGTAGLVVMHGDLHPYNVIQTPDGPVVIDWRNAEEGTPEFDIAMTAIIFAQVAVDPGPGPTCPRCSARPSPPTSPNPSTPRRVCRQPWIPAPATSP